MKETPKAYVLDTNVLIHDPQALLNFQEHLVIIPMTVLEELDKLKVGHQAVAADCRQAIRLIDSLLGNADPKQIANGIDIYREATDNYLGKISILMGNDPSENNTADQKQSPSIFSLPNTINDNLIINQVLLYQSQQPQPFDVVLVTKDINMRLKARGCGLISEDYQTDQLVSDVNMLPSGFHKVDGSIWDQLSVQESRHQGSATLHKVESEGLPDDLMPNQFLIDDNGFTGRLVAQADPLQTCCWIREVHSEALLHKQAWGLRPRDLHQAMALDLLMDPEIHLVILSGSAGSGKTILALAAAIEQTVSSKEYRHIIVTRSAQGLDEDIGYLPGTEQEKMEPWLGAITDNLEALHINDENPSSSMEYLQDKAMIQFKSLNYIRGRSFQQSFILIDECQNLTPHQMKTIITRAGKGSKVVCLGNLAQIDTPYINATSSGLTYLTERFKHFERGGHIQLQNVPRSQLAEYAEKHL
ncbi:PhoH family protein [Pelagibaculum spongiae]|uniref:Ribonuclease n=1 Tax=Pelagibaculum spongiae TaxID=2080658 RepID=A0A2V1GZE5_9GAMM|nr:PhoH family protein [Pelagibaculum spongiae]PVZ72116.1 ribonuclease [Pelagibaculum spongiae]